MLSRLQISEVFSRLAEATPEPRTELEYLNTYTLLVAVILSAQATDAGVNKATKALFLKVDSPQKMLMLGEGGLREYIKTIGLYNAKGKNIIAMSQKLIDDFGGEVPASLEELEQLPGVGRKTANVLMNCAFGQPTIAVDTHVFRVANRTGMVRGGDVRRVEDGLLKKIPKQWLMHAHHWLILHGRYVCKARKPDCWRCVISDICEYVPKNL